MFELDPKVAGNRSLRLIFPRTKRLGLGLLCHGIDWQPCAAWGFSMRLANRIHLFGINRLRVSPSPTQAVPPRRRAMAGGSTWPGWASTGPNVNGADVATRQGVVRVLASPHERLPWAIIK